MAAIIITALVSYRLQLGMSLVSISILNATPHRVFKSLGVIGKSCRQAKDGASKIESAYLPHQISCTRHTSFAAVLLIMKIISLS